MANSQLSYYCGGPAPATPGSLWEWLSGPGGKKPDTEALSALQQPASHLCHFTKSQAPAGRDYFSWTYRELLDAVDYVAGSFTQAGVQPGDVIAVFMNNRAEWGLLLWVSFRLGVTFTPICPSTLGRPEELTYMLQSLNPRAIVVEDGIAAQAMDQNGTGFDLMKLRIICEGGQQGECPSGWVSLPHLQPAGPSVTLPPTTSNPDAIAYIIFTSGTTSFPKGCPLTVRNVIGEITGYHSFRGGLWDSTVRALLTSMCFRPVCYLAALNSWAGGGCVIIPCPFFDDDTVLRTITSQKITNMMIVPNQVRSLSSSATLGTHRPSTLRLLTCSGDTCTVDVIAYGREQLRVKHLVFHWGMSEGAPLFGWPGDEPVPVSSQGDVPGIGRALPGTAVRICGGTDGKTVVPRGTIGDMQVDSDSLIDNYLSTEHTNSAFVTDEAGRRWFQSGDLAYMDESGVIFIVGRSKDLIKCKSVGIVPSILEDFIEKTYQDEVRLQQSHTSSLLVRY